ncbi:MAG: protein translocase subunit SecF [Bdellovibrionales bacterium]|nr:protein translocase subunit SecF [Bdellovibrionales bacterium]
MALDKDTFRFDFMRVRHFFVVLSFVVIGLSLWEWQAVGLKKYGLDFVGGTEVVVRFDPAVSIGAVRSAVEKAGVENAVVQELEVASGEGSEFSIRVKLPPHANPATGAEEDDANSKMPDRIVAALRNIPNTSIELRKEDYVGPTIGDEIRQSGLTALALSFLGLLVYLTIRFEMRFAFGAMFAIVHDVMVTAGIFVLSGRELSASVLAALLTIIGYSLNDTIVIFDRIRENVQRTYKKGGADRKITVGKDFLELINISISETLSRTLLTSLTTLFVVATLLALGGSAMSDLAFTLFVGIITGTYSTLFIACPVVVALERFGATPKTAKAKSASSGAAKHAQL